MPLRSTSESMQTFTILSLSTVLLSLLSSCGAFQPLAAVAPSRQIMPTPSLSYRRECGCAKLFYQDDGGEPDRRTTELVNSFLKASRSSFKNVETSTNQLLNAQPLVALSIFVGMGVLVAYILGFFFLGGYIETWNPVENDAIPYWDDEVLVITRVVGR